MSLGTIQLGSLSVSRLIIGGNPFSGFSHQGLDRDTEMRRYYTTDRIKKTLAQAEEVGINSFIGRGDNHVIRMLLEYADEGGQIQWIAQTTPELRTSESAIDRALRGGASACYIHGGHTDNLLAQGRLDDLAADMEHIRKAGLPAGIAGHDPRVFEWADANLDLDFYACCYYNPSSRAERSEHVAGGKEWFRQEDRDRMVELIQTLSRPVIHYKIMAAGRTDPAEAFAFTARHLRPQDGICVGVHTGDRPDMLAQDVKLLEAALASEGNAGA